MPTAIPSARTTLHATLQALTATGQPLDGCAVIRTGSWQQVPEPSRVVVLNARDITREWRSVGAKRLTETFTIPVLVETIQDGDGDALEPVETALWALVTEIERAVMADLTLGGTVLHCRPAGADEEQSGPTQDHNTIVARTTLRFACEAVVDLS